ncbi:MAG: PEP-CTERM sorting domain-containing protein [Planctomycetaceae bacterium]|nr:PEP-CTERM sorting domain-containing protein [Planctomycetaceae bacterium]
MRFFTKFLCTILLCGVGSNLEAATLANANWDTDSYIAFGTNNEFDPGITINTDYSGGADNPALVHFNFGVIKFDDLAGLSTKSAGGGDKFLKLSTLSVPGASTIGVSAAKLDISSTTDGYPSPSFPGTPAGDGLARLQWYQSNIKGNDAAFGGYAGGADHLGVLEVPAMGDYYLDVTSTVDAWIDGSEANNGFGLWGADVAGGQGNSFDFISSDNAAGGGPQLVSAVPEPSSLVLTVLAIGFIGLLRRR